MLKDIFEQFGLGDREAKVYQVCIELGQSTISQIQSLTNLSRSTVYYSIDLLKKNNLVTESFNKKKTYYIAENPKNIQSILDRKKSKIDNAIVKLNNIIPDLESIRSQKKIINSSFYRGIEETSRLYENIYKNHPNSTVYAFSSYQKEHDQKVVKIFKNIISYRLKYNIKIQGISPCDKNKLAVRDKDEQQLRESRFLPMEKYPFKSDVVIFSDVICYATFENNEPIAVVIEDSNMVATMKMIFELCWEAAEKYDKEIMEQYSKDPDFIQKLEAKQIENTKK